MFGSIEAQTSELLDLCFCLLSGFDDSVNLRVDRLNEVVQREHLFLLLDIVGNLNTIST